MTLLDLLADRVAAVRPGRRALIAVDGVDCAGKTTFADALAARLHRPVVRAGVDDFPQPRAVRHRRGRLSPEGAYRDTTDLAALERELLRPFAQGRPHRTRTWALHADAPELPCRTTAPADAVLLLDGVYVQRPELAPWWHLVVRLVVPQDEVLRRAARRDGPASVPVYEARYLPAQALYVAEADPDRRAAVLVDNTHPRRPVLLRG